MNEWQHSSVLVLERKHNDGALVGGRVLDVLVSGEEVVRQSAHLHEFQLRGNDFENLVPVQPTRLNNNRQMNE